MSNNSLNWIANFILGIADDVLRDLYVRGKYRDVILPMMVLRRLDAVLEPTKQAVLDNSFPRKGTRSYLKEGRFEMVLLMIGQGRANANRQEGWT
jgi:type I restriction-modification system DNA methylase subunit